MNSKHHPCVDGMFLKKEKRKKKKKVLIALLGILLTPTYLPTV